MRTRDHMTTARKRLALFTRIQQQAARRGVHVARARDWRLSRNWYYSPLVDLEELGEAFWQRRSPMHGVTLDPAAQLAWAEAELAPYLREFTAPQTAPPGRELEYFTDNEHFEAVDAEVTYAMVRHGKPKRIVELGSGFSTQVLARAVVRNRDEGFPCELVTYNPYPSDRMRAVLAAGVDGLAAHREVRAQDVPLDTITSLQAGDVLFIDTTHVVKVGSEVVHLFLEVLPLVADGVVVHIHDIALPYEYPKRFIVGFEMGWAEQYLLQALLQHNPTWEVVFADQAVVRADFARMQALVPNLREHHVPSGWWMRRTLG